MPRFFDLDQFRTDEADWWTYPHQDMDYYNPQHDSAYEWRDDLRMHPTGVFPRNDGQSIDHYNPFGVLDFRQGVGDRQYHAMEEGYNQDIGGHVYNMQDDWGGYDNYNDMMAGPTTDWEDNMRWSRREGTGRSGYAITDLDPYNGTDAMLGGYWQPPHGGDFGVFNPSTGRRGNSYFSNSSAPPRGLRDGYYLDRDDYVGENSWYPAPTNGIVGMGPNDARYAYYNGDEILGDRALRATAVDYWPEQR